MVLQILQAALYIRNRRKWKRRPNVTFRPRPCWWSNPRARKPPRVLNRGIIRRSPAPSRSSLRAPAQAAGATSPPLRYNLPSPRSRQISTPHKKNLGGWGVFPGRPPHHPDQVCRGLSAPERLKRLDTLLLTAKKHRGENRRGRCKPPIVTHWEGIEEVAEFRNRLDTAPWIWPANSRNRLKFRPLNR